MENSADFGYTSTCRSYGAECLFDLVSINMTPLTGLETAKVISPTVSGKSRLSVIIRFVVPGETIPKPSAQNPGSHFSLSERYI